MKTKRCSPQKYISILLAPVTINGILLFPPISQGTIFRFWGSSGGKRDLGYDYIK